MVLLKVIRKGLNGNQGNGIHAICLEIVMIVRGIVGTVANRFNVILLLLVVSIFCKETVHNLLHVGQLALCKAIDIT